MLKQKKCLVLSSFSEKDLIIVDQLKKALSELGLILVHPTDISLGTPLFKAVSDLIHQSDLIIAEISKPNPNLYIDIGRAEGAGKPIILVASQGTEIPVSLSKLNVVKYEEQLGLEKKAINELTKQVNKHLLLPAKKQLAIIPKIYRESKIDLSNPFSSLNAESMDANTLARTFVVPPYFDELLCPENTLLIGPRGCGKTTVLQFMRFKNSKYLSEQRFPRIAGFYLNFNTLFRFIDAEKKILSNKRSTILYLNLCFLHTILNDLEALFRNEELSKNERSQILSLVNKLIGISEEAQPSKSLTPVLSDYLLSIRAGKPIDPKIEENVSNVYFLYELAKTLYEQTKLFYKCRILFLLDDYANDWIPNDVASAINQVLFQSSAECAFKIATIPGRQNFSFSRSFDIRPARDYIAINLAPNVVFKNIKSRTAFLQKILDNRLHSVGSPLSSKQLFGSASTSAGIDYSGIDGLTKLCNSDYSSIILICNHMITQSESLEKQIAREIQNRVIIDYSKQLVNSLHHGYEWGEYVYGFLDTMMNFIKGLSRKPKKSTRELKFISERMYGSLVFRNIDKLTPESQKRLLWLIRSGVLQEASTLVSENRRFVFKLLLFPCFRLPISGFRSSVDLDTMISEFLLDRPREFWEYFSNKLGRPDEVLFQ